MGIANTIIRPGQMTLPGIVLAPQPRGGSVNRAIGGARAKAAGKSFERLIMASQNNGHEQICVLTHVKSFALWIPADPAWQRATGQRMKLVQQPSPYDFAGIVCGSGIGVFFDAKSCGVDVASLAVNNPKIVKPHQIDELERLEDGGAFAGFLIRCERAKDYRFLWARRARRKHPVPWTDPAWEILGPIRDGYGVPLQELFRRYD